MLDVRNSRLDEINRGMDLMGGGHNPHSKLIGHDPSRTLQPSMKIVNLQAIELEAKKDEEEKQQEKVVDKTKTAKIKIFKTHRYFSDHEDINNQHNDLD